MRPAIQERVVSLWVTVAVLAYCVVLAAYRWLIAGRFWGVRYDLMASSFGERPGEGYVGEFLVIFSSFAAMLGLSACIYAICRKLGGSRWLWLLLMPIAILPALGFRRTPSRADLPMMVRNGEPLIQALVRYKADHKAYPVTLDSLVPKYLNAIPGTGLIQGRRFVYITAADSNKELRLLTRTPTELAGNPYVVVVPMIPAGTLVYRPNGEYSDLPGNDAGSGWRWTYLD